MMATEEMRDGGPKLSMSDIGQFERRIGSALPAEYRDFLLKFNGGRRKPNEFVVPGWPLRFSLVNDFFGILPGHALDLEANRRLLRGRIPASALPVANDPGGNYILLELSGSNAGAVYFWDHENQPEMELETLAEYPNVYRLASNFDEFLASLKHKDELRPSGTGS